MSIGPIIEVLYVPGGNPLDLVVTLGAWGVIGLLGYVLWGRFQEARKRDAEVRKNSIWEQ